MSADEFRELELRVEAIRDRLAAEGKVIHEIINGGISALENLRELEEQLRALREHHVALVKDADLVAAQLAARSPT